MIIMAFSNVATEVCLRASCGPSVSQYYFIEPFGDTVFEQIWYVRREILRSDFTERNFFCEMLLHVSRGGVFTGKAAEP